MTSAEKLLQIAALVDRCAVAVGNHSLDLTGHMHIGTHAFRLGFDRLIEARSLFEAAARLEAANTPEKTPL
jgi:hypothetical protein